MPPPDTGRVVLRRGATGVNAAVICLMATAATATAAFPFIWHVRVLDPSDWQTYAGLAVFWWTASITGSALLYQQDARCARRSTATVVIMVRASATKRELAELEELLLSLMRQSVLPASVILVENGPKRSTRVEGRFTRWMDSPFTQRIADKQYLYCPAPSKRLALMMAVDHADPTTVIMTVDSYTLCDAAAVEEGLKGFADPSVLAATGLLVGRRSQRNPLAKATDQLFTASFLQERAAYSTFGVLGSTRGGLAFYRAWLLRGCREKFLSQTIAGHEVDDGDDRALTTLCLRNGGKAVFLPRAVGYTRHPETLGDLSGRYARWFRTFWRSNIELLVRPPARRAATWLGLAQSAVYVIQGLAYPAALVVEPLVTGRPPWPALAFVGAITACRTVSVLGVKHAGQSLGRQAAGFVLLLPFAVMLDLWLSVVQMWRGLLSMRHTEWQAWHVETSTMSVR